MSARLEIGTPTRPTSPSASRRVRVVAHLGRQVEGDRQPGLALLEEVAEARFVSSAVAKPAYWRIVQRRLRYIVGWTPRVNGGSPGQPEVAILVERRSRSAGGVEVRRSRCRSSSRSARGARAPTLRALARVVARQRSRPGSVASRRRARPLVGTAPARARPGGRRRSIVPPGADRDPLDGAGPRGPELVLHLHRLDDEERAGRPRRRRRRDRTADARAPG